MIGNPCEDCSGTVREKACPVPDPPRNPDTHCSNAAGTCSSLLTAVRAISGQQRPCAPRQAPPMRPAPPCTSSFRPHERNQEASGRHAMFLGHLWTSRAGATNLSDFSHNNRPPLCSSLRRRPAFSPILFTPTFPVEAPMLVPA